MTVLYLSRLVLRRDAALNAIASLLVPEESGARTGVVHRLIWSAFADTPERRRDFLWRAEGTHRWLVLSQRTPEDPHGFFEIESKVFAPALAQGDRLAFALRANAVITHKDEKGRAKRHDVVMERLRAFPAGKRAMERDRLAQEAGRDWLGAQGIRAGFDPQTINAVYHTEQIPRKGERPIELGLLDLEGEISVSDPVAFLPALAAGFGKAKGFGCGLMLIRRAR